MKPLFLTILICLIALTTFADQDSCGYDWTKCSQQQKYALMISMFDFYGLNKETYSLEKAIGLLDDYYSSTHQQAQHDLDLDEDVCLSVPCLLIFGDIATEKEMDLCYQPQGQDNAGIMKGLRTVGEFTVYVGMPKDDLEQAGYTADLQQDCRKQGSEEWLTFSDWTTETPNDTVTFHIVDDKVHDWHN